MTLTDETPTISETGARRHRALTVGSVVALFALIGLLLRWLVLRSPAGILFADEAYTGIQSFEVLGGQFPVVLGGTAYTLPLEAYLYAPFAAIVGTDIVQLKLLSSVSWAPASVVLGLVAARFSNKRTGAVAGTLCWLAPGALLIVSVNAYSAYASGMLVSIAALCLAGVVVDADEPNRRPSAFFGVLAGFGFWLHPMFLASLVPMVLVVLWTHRRRIDTWIAVIAGGLIGCAPLLLWNAVNSWPSLEAPTEVEGTYPERLRTFAEDLIPRAFGLRDFGLDWQPNAVIAAPLYLALIAATVAGVVLLVRRPGPRSRILLPAVLVGVFPIMALFQNLIFAADGRYGIISFPFIVLAISIAVDALIGRTSMFRAVGVSAVVALVWVAGFILPTLSPLIDDTDGNPNARLEAIVDRLDEAGIDRIYGSYWAVLPVEFAGDRRIVGGVFPFWPIRFPERQRTVEATPIDEIAILFITTDEDPARLPMPVENYERSVFGEFVLYVPTSTPGAG